MDRHRALSYAHPPLANAITTLPYAGLGDEPWGPAKTPTGELDPRPAKAGQPGPDATRAEVLPTLSGWDVANPLHISTAYFQHDFRRAKAELTGARRMMMLWTLALGLGLYAWVERRYGWTAAIVALALFCLNPTLLAHGRLMTTDMPLAALVFASLAATVAWIERPSWAHVGLFWLATTAMVLIKHSGLMFTVVLSLIVLGAALGGRSGFVTQAPRWRRVAVVFGQLSLVAVVMIFAIAAAYRFDRVGLSVAEILAEPEPHNWISGKHQFELLEHSPIAKLPGSLRLPFPYTWLVGLATVSEQNARGHGQYFFGMRSKAGHPLYFPVMLFAKSPTGLLVLLGAAAGLAIARLRRREPGARVEWPSTTTTVLVLFAAVSLASACASNINIGVRHVLPLILIMIVFAARAAQLLMLGGFAWLGRRGGLALVTACLVGSLIGVAWVYPAFLGDFSLLVGGPTGGHRISVIGEDWGQDVGDLAVSPATTAGIGSPTTQNSRCVVRSSNRSGSRSTRSAVTTRAMAIRSPFTSATGFASDRASRGSAIERRHTSSSTTFWCFRLPVNGVRSLTELSSAAASLAHGAPVRAKTRHARALGLAWCHCGRRLHAGPTRRLIARPGDRRRVLGEHIGGHAYDTTKVAFERRSRCGCAARDYFTGGRAP